MAWLVPGSISTSRPRERSREAIVRRRRPPFGMILSLALALGIGVIGGALGTAFAEVEPCSLLTLAEVGAVLRGPATQDRPHRVRTNNVTVGGDCTYRSPINRSLVVTLHVDAYPGGHQRASFERGRQRPHVVGVSGLGDLAYAVTPPSGLQTVTFLQGEVLVSVMAQGLGVAEARQLATLVAARLPASAAQPPAPPVRPPVSAAPPAAAPASPPGGGPDPALVGTWKFDGVAADILWAVRTDGSYRLHGFGAQLPQRGRIEATRGRWSVTAPNWQDSGSYDLAGADTWRVTGKLGTGAWKRVWRPGQTFENGPGHGGVCLLVRPAEVAGLVDSAVGDPEGIGARRQGTGEALEGCRYTSRLNGADRVEIRLNAGSTIARSFEQDKRAAGASLAVPGVGLDAYASLSKNVVTLRALTATRIMTLTLHLAPGVVSDDLAGLVELARLASQRLR